MVRLLNVLLLAGVLLPAPVRSEDAKSSPGWPDSAR